MLLCVIALAGCAVPNVRSSTVAMRTSDGTTETVPSASELLSYRRQLAVMSPAELGQEKDSVESRHSVRETSLTRLKLGLVLGEPRTPGHDAQRAESLLEGVLSSEQAAGECLPELVTLYLQEARAIQDANDLRLEAERTAAVERDRRLALQRELDAASSALERERQRNETLAGQLQALRSIEQRINERLAPAADTRQP